MAQRVAYVTGGMGGIGAAICRRLHQAGFKVIAGCSPSRDWQKWLGEQKAEGFEFHASVANVADWDSTVEAFAKAAAEPDAATRFDEPSCAAGRYGGFFPALSLMPVALACAGKLAKFGA